MYVCEYAMHVCVCVHVCLCKCLFPNSGSYRVLVVFNAKPQQLLRSPVQSPSTDAEIDADTDTETDAEIDAIGF